ncbi:MAG TPA: hypothetical protein VK936_15900 [Longimicrobiales bacterium]|nr:hypothetical protein [Longimicrobiales bacterium]
MDFGILILIIFILAPLLEKLLKAGRPPQELPPGQRQRMPPPGQRRQAPGPRPARPAPTGAADPDDSAAGVLPDDLWEILTGEQRTPRQPAPRTEWEEIEAREAPAPMEGPREARNVPAPRPMPDRTPQTRPAPVRERRLPPVDIRRRSAQAGAARPRSAGPPPSAADDLVRRVKVHRPPEVVSLETAIEDPELRRARFQERLAEMSAPALGGGPRGAHEYAFSSPDQLRRAIIMAEILGRPKGLE